MSKSPFVLENVKTNKLSGSVGLGNSRSFRFFNLREDEKTPTTVGGERSAFWTQRGGTFEEPRVARYGSLFEIEFHRFHFGVKKLMNFDLKTTFTTDRDIATAFYFLTSVTVEKALKHVWSGLTWPWPLQNILYESSI